VLQTLPADRFEVIVVDDGSTDGMADTLAALTLPASFRYLHQPNRGAAAARNLGVREAVGELVLLLDGDVIAATDLLEEHMKSHEPGLRILVAGRLKGLPVRDGGLFYQVMDFSTSFDHGDESKMLAFQDTFAGNLSLKRELFWRIGGFEEEFSRSGFEDTEFFYRATRMGFDVVYNPHAVGYHDSVTTFEQACQHMRSYQAWAVLLMKKHPELKGQIEHLRDKEPIHWGEDEPGLVARKIARRVLAFPPVIWGMKRIITVLELCLPCPSWLRFLYWKVLSSYLLLGFRDGLRRYGSPFAREGLE
jgi:GT2 family glycosyltransferase